jgi:hypothetical protein
VIVVKRAGYQAPAVPAGVTAEDDGAVVVYRITPAGR